LPTFAAGSSPARTHRITVILETRNRRATSSSVSSSSYPIVSSRRRAGCDLDCIVVIIQDHSRSFNIQEAAEPDPVLCPHCHQPVPDVPPVVRIEDAQVSGLVEAGVTAAAIAAMAIAALNATGSSVNSLIQKVYGASLSTVSQPPPPDPAPPAGREPDRDRDRDREGSPVANRKRL
jgi:hypothetical protein